MSATFELERFAWDDGAFEVAGRWTADEDRSLGRTRLVVEVDGRRRRIGAVGGKQASAGEWTARFGHQRRPERVGPAELEVGGDLVIDLPKPELPPAPAGPPPELRGAEALLDQLRSERAQTEAAARRLKDEREAAEAASRRLAEERAGAESAAKAAHEAAEAAKQAKPPPPPPPAPEPAPAPRPAFHYDSPRRAEIREALARPGGPKHVLPAERPARRREAAYALAALIVIVIVLLVVLLL